MRILLRRVPRGLTPIDEISEELLAKVNVGEVVTVTIKKARNPKLQALYWAALHKVFHNQERYRSVDELHDVLRLEAGASRLLKLRDGTEVRVPISTSFDDMDDVAFRAFVDRAFDVIASKWLIDVRDDEARRELEVMVGARAA